MRSITVVESAVSNPPTTAPVELPTGHRPPRHGASSAEGAILDEISGYTVNYNREEGPFPVYAVGFIAAALLAGALVTANWALFSLGLIAFAFTYYNFPRTETGRPRLGANQYGIFIEGFGIIHWRAVDRVELAVIAVRALTLHELQITLKQPLHSALIADWRKVPWYRMLMRLPWKMAHNNVVRITLDPFDREPEDIHRTLLRMWRYYRS